MTRTIVLRSLLAGAVLGTAGLLAACTGAPPAPADATSTAPASTSPAPTSGASSASPSASAAPSVTTPAARATVASTGASIPVNGKPTLVFVDAIW